MVNLIKNIIIHKYSESGSISAVPKPEKNHQQIEQNKQNSLKKAMLPASLIASGGLLIYYGVKKPGAVKFVKNLVKERLDQIDKGVREFSELTSETVKKEFINSDTPRIKYQKDRWFNVQNSLDSINSAKDTTELINAQNDSFKAIRNEIMKNFREGASDFDVYKLFLSRIAGAVLSKVEPKRFELSKVFSDYTHVPNFESGKHTELIEKSKNKIIERTNLAYKQMYETQCDTIGKEISSNSNAMAQIILRGRELISDAKKSIIDSSFAKIRELFGIGEDFVPTYSKLPTVENFEKLSPEQLKAQNLTDEIKKIFESNPLGEILETTDFSKPNQTLLKDTFGRMSELFTIEDIGFYIDRLRLQEATDKALGKNNADLYSTLIAKLEFLSVNLRKICDKDIIQRCSIDFDKLNIEQQRSKLYYIQNTAKKLGLNSLEETDHYLAESYPEYLESSVHKNIEQIKNNSEKFFF
ncbi:hypothetical protein HDR58_03245 [bacterium]|nr:hypothetical protein [bacterium]